MEFWRPPRSGAPVAPLRTPVPRFVLSLTCVAALAGCSAQLFLRVDQRRIDERLLFFLGGGGNSLVLTHGSEAFVCDVKFGSTARQLRFDVERELVKSARRLLLTHSHLDHTGGLALYSEVGAVVVHPNTRKRLQAEGAIAPFVEVDRELQLLIAGETVRILFAGVGHTDGDLVALLVNRRLLIAGDLLVNGFEPSIDETAGGNALAFRATLDRVLELDFTEALPGHGEPMTRAQVVQVRDYLLAVETVVRQERALGKTVDEAARDIHLDGFDAFEPLAFGASSREKTIRQMYRALESP